MLYIASDHGGYSMKNQIIEHLEIECTDLGCFSIESCDYPNIANILCERIQNEDIGILICGSGIGITIAANRHPHIRCALCHDNLTAKLSRQHNNANVLALGGRILGIALAWDIVHAFLDTQFDGGDRHIKRTCVGHKPAVAKKLCL